MATATPTSTEMTLVVFTPPTLSRPGPKLPCRVSGPRHDGCHGGHGAGGAPLSSAIAVVLRGLRGRDAGGHGRFGRQRTRHVYPAGPASSRHRDAKDRFVQGAGDAVVV